MFKIGTAGGLISQALTWVADRMDTLDHLLATLTHIIGLCVAVVTLLLLLHRWKHRADMPPKEPPDIDDDLP